MTCLEENQHKTWQNILVLASTLFLSSHATCHSFNQRGKQIGGDGYYVVVKNHHYGHDNKS